MILCEHFIYTAGIVGNKNGYQIISKSSSLDDKVVSELENYFYPLGVNLSEFSVSTSLLILKEDVAFTKVRNIGIGFDGRPDTIYSHTIVMKKKDFKKFSNDSRIFNDKYIETTKSDHLKPILIKEKNLLPDFVCVDELGMVAMEQIFIGLLNKKKISLVNTDSQRLIQSILSLIPSSMSMVSYSTNVAEPKKQSKYNIIQIKKNNLVKSSNNVIIDKEIVFKKINESNPLLNLCVRYILNVMNSKESKKLAKINHQIESMPGDIIKKIILGTSLIIVSEEPHKFSKRYFFRLERMLKETPNVPDKITSELYLKLNELFNKQESGEFEIEKIILKFNNEKLNITTIGKMFGELIENNENSCNFLFHQLVKRRISDFKENGQDLLLNSINRYYNNQIIRGFVEESKLHFAFEKIFTNNNISEYEKINLFSISIKHALCHNIQFLENLFEFNVYNLEDDDQVLKFKKNIQCIFSSKKFHQSFNPEKILKILIIIQKKIIPLFPKNKKSGTIDQKFYQMEEILNILLNTARYLLTMRKFSLGSSKNEITSFENTLSEFLSKNYLPNTKQVNWSDLNLTDRITSVLTWKLFIDLPY